MSGIRLDRLLTSTAILLVLTAAAGGALADPATPDTTATIPALGNTSAATPSDATQQPDQSTTGSTSPAAAVPAPAAPAPAASTPTAPAPAAAEAPVAAPATIVAASPDAPIADQLHNLTGGKFDQIIGNKQVRTQIDAFYSGRNYAPIWLTDGKANDRAASAIAYLGHVDADGLDPADYPVPNFAAISDAAALANAEIQLTTSVLTYAHHAAVGRVHWSRVSPDIEYNEKAPDPADVLAGIVAASDVAAALDAYEPQTPGYIALKSKYTEIRAGKLDKAANKIGAGAVLKTGMQDDRVPMLRERLNVLGDGGTTFDKPLADAVKKFQQQHQLTATGTLTPATVDAINGKEPDHAADIILANLERWRWMPHHFAENHVVVNLPDFTLHVVHGDKEVWQTRIVIGKPDKPTPLMTADMKYITVNPTWNVPPSIVNHEYLPALAQDPTVLDRMGLKVDHNRDGTVHIWQPPGDKNALGRIRFNFPNKFLVYQHDTPDKYMFAYDKRAFSHGCMRVQNPPHYAEVLLSLVRPNDGYSEDRIKKMIADGGETDIQFPTYVQVNLTYQTAFVDEDGKLQFRDDVYGRDKELLAILKGEDRKSLDVAVEHKVDPSQREVLAMPDEPALFGGSRGLFGSGRGSPGGGGDNFFSRLFGGFASDPAPPVPHKPIPHTRKVTRSGENTVTR
ncbi:MAG: L,D-transpeptidase family protein [Xanthobacteraceae bacterium]